MSAELPETWPELIKIASRCPAMANSQAVLLDWVDTRQYLGHNVANNESGCRKCKVGDDAFRRGTCEDSETAAVDMPIGEL